MPRNYLPGHRKLRDEVCDKLVMAYKELEAAGCTSDQAWAVIATTMIPAGIVTAASRSTLQSDAGWGLHALQAIPDSN